MAPRTIWCLWFQGWANAPDLVRACGASWRQHNPAWAIHYLSADTAKARLGDDPALEELWAKDLPIEAVSDVVRIELIARFGGVWVDSTVYCLRPLDRWLPQAMPRGFFAFNQPAPDRMLSSWFLAAEPGCHIVEAWRRAVRAYWRGRRQRDNYFWFHDLFADTYRSDPQVRAIWDATPKLSADGPHCFAPYDQQLLAPVSERHRAIVERAELPVLKLTHKVAHDQGGQGTSYRWLCDRVTDRPIFSDLPANSVSESGSLRA
jgi:Capsular polysaccharide synthesis protein